MKIIDINNTPRECHRVFLDKKWPGYVSVEFKSKNNPDKTRIEWMPLADFAEKNPQLKELFKDHSLKAAPETSGIVTSANNNILTDETASWPENAYAGYFLWISRGPADGSTRIILENTHSTLTLDKPWIDTPTIDSQYAILRKLPQIQGPTGNVLPTTELRNLEEKARQMDLEAGRTPQPRQYTKGN